MRKSEFKRLLKYHIAKKHAPRNTKISKRSAKHNEVGRWEIKTWPKIIPSTKL